MGLEVNVPIYIESRYKVNRKKIKESVAKILSEYKINTRCEVSIAIVGNRKMRSLNNKYRNIDMTTNVLSFPQNEGEMKAPIIENTLYLGDIVISFPKVIEEASRENMLVDDKIGELIDHSVKHLLGIHHR